ncbi:MAG: sigma-70 family RNA polymerase sigma factor [Chloroflexota bacterium]
MPYTQRTKSQAHSPVDIEGLVTAYYDYVHRLTLSILDDPGEAEDAAQEAFIAAERALPGYRGQATPKTWLTTIAVNFCRRRLRRRRGRAALQAALQAVHLLAAPEDGPEQTAIQDEARRELWQAVDALGEKHRLPLILRYVHELSVPEIAASLGLNEGTVHSRLHYARQKLATELGKTHPQAEVRDDAG